MTLWWCVGMLCCGVLWDAVACVGWSADALQLLGGLESIGPLLQSTCLAHVSPDLSSELSHSVESLTAALRELTHSPAYEQSALYPKLQQSTAERITQRSQTATTPMRRSLVSIVQYNSL